MSVLKNFPKNTVPGYNPDRYEIRLNQPLYKRVYEGDIGLEIEMEGDGYQSCMFTKDGFAWVVKEDHSLRGAGAREYVFNQPVPIALVPEMVNELFAHLQRTGANYRDSNRTSIHVHLNAQGLKINQLCSWISIWGILEDVLVNYCGPYRVGNLFCLRIKDTDWIIDQLVRLFQTGDGYVFRDNARYLAMNPSALSKFNSLEFRSMRGTFDSREILDWIDILWRVFEFSKSFPNPEDIAASFSGDGPYGFLERAVGERHARAIIAANIDDNADRLIWNGIRRIQPVIYSMPWSLLMNDIEAIAIPNPFPKPKKKSQLGLYAEEMAAPMPRYDGEPARGVLFGGGPVEAPVERDFWANQANREG